MQQAISAISGSTHQELVNALGDRFELSPVSDTQIAPVAPHTLRPRVSVVIPVYEPTAHLIVALRSVLAQDLGPSQMQIAIVDDASPTRDVASMIKSLAPAGRIELYRCTTNQGLAGNWNQCIRVARGHVVHILHQDDWVSDGFYQRMLPVFAAHPNVGMAFCRHAIAESPDHIVRVSHRERWRAGVLCNWLDKIAVQQRIQCAAVLVRRSVYEHLGGFRFDLRYALDWEMWVRIAAHYDVWYEPKRMAYYRKHAGSETQRLHNSASVDRDVVRAIEILGEYLPTNDRLRLRDAAYANFVKRTTKRIARDRVSRSRAGPRFSFLKEICARISSPNLRKSTVGNVDRAFRA